MDKDSTLYKFSKESEKDLLNLIELMARNKDYKFKSKQAYKWNLLFSQVII